MPGLWSRRDDIVYRTLGLVDAVRTGNTRDVEPIPVRFGLRSPHAEVPLARSGFRLDEFSALGDGSYGRTTWIAGGTGSLGVATIAMTAGASHLVNRARRKAAEADAVPRWHTITSGSVVVTTHGFYLETADRVLSWHWGAVEAADVSAQGQLRMQGSTSDHRTVQWRVATDWAELMFLLWAMHRNPHHPRCTDLTWLIPPGLHDRAVARASTTPELLPGPPSPEPQPAPAGWYRDPLGGGAAHQRRWWDGSGWTRRSDPDSRGRVSDEDLRAAPPARR